MICFVVQSEAVLFIGNTEEAAMDLKEKYLLNTLTEISTARTYDLRTVKADLHRFGVYEGQKLRVTYEGGMPPELQEWAGYYLAPKLPIILSIVFHHKFRPLFLDL